MSKSSAHSGHSGHEPYADKTSKTDDERIRNVTPLPPPESLIRFFPIRGTPVETLVADTRKAIRKIINGKDDRMLVKDGQVVALNVEGGGGYKVSDADTLLAQAKAL